MTQRRQWYWVFWLQTQYMACSLLPLQEEMGTDIFVHFLFCLFFFLLHCTACGILVPWSGIKPTLPALVQSLNHWTTREVQPLFYFLSFKASQSQKVQPPKLRENHAYPSCAVRLWIKNKLLHLSSWHAFQLHMTFKYSTAQQNSPDGGKVAIEHRVM